METPKLNRYAVYFLVLTCITCAHIILIKSLLRSPSAAALTELQTAMLQASLVAMEYTAITLFAFSGICIFAK